jgi:hypothetical protein
MADVQNSEVDAPLSPFSLSQHWVAISEHSRCNHGNKGMWLTVEQTEPICIAGLKYKGNVKVNELKNKLNKLAKIKLL